MQHPLPLKDSPKSLVGSLIGEKWLVDGVLGEGGMGKVYSAVHQHNARRVAIKVLNASFAHDPGVRERFYQEAYAANRVLHPGTVGALDDGLLGDGTPFLVMELLQGRDLEGHLNDSDGALDEREVLRIIVELLSILEAAHDAGVLHRDIKPENIFCTLDGKIKLLDFGIAKVTDSRRSHATQCGSTIGTPAFMPPEQARGRWDELDASSDLWSVGATMFTLLSGRMVHQSETVNEQLLKAMTESPASLKSVAPEASSDVIAIVDRALQFEQADRYTSASEMRHALELALTARGELPHAPTPSLAPSGRDSSRPRTTHRPVVSSQTTLAVTAPKKRTRAIIAAALLLSAAAGAVFVFTGVLPGEHVTHIQGASPATPLELDSRSIEFVKPELPEPEPSETSANGNDSDGDAESASKTSNVKKILVRYVPRSKDTAPPSPREPENKSEKKSPPASKSESSFDFDPLAQRR